VHGAYVLFEGDHHGISRRINRKFTMGYDLTQMRDSTKKIIPILLICQKSYKQLFDKYAG